MTNWISRKHYSIERLWPTKLLTMQHIRTNHQNNKNKFSNYHQRVKFLHFRKLGMPQTLWTSQNMFKLFISLCQEFHKKKEQKTWLIEVFRLFNQNVKIVPVLTQHHSSLKTKREKLPHILVRRQKLYTVTKLDKQLFLQEYKLFFLRSKRVKSNFKEILFILRTLF